MLKSAFSDQFVEAGCDEAGRGCLAGPVFAAAVILPRNFTNPILDDSKKLTPSHRERMRRVIESEAVSWAVAMVDNREIDKINILNASILAMHKALKQLNVRPGNIIVDGNRFKPFENLPHTCFVKGDGRYLSIAAASVLAKTYRDDYMKKLHTDFPEYGWNQNKGYPTEIHRSAIVKYGITEHHRKSFRLTDDQLKLDL